MRTWTVAVAIALTAMTASCGGDEPEPAASAPAESGSDAPAGDAQQLLATVGTEDDPDAFEIALTTEDGEPVENLPAGDYTIEVDDRSEIHNFHLVGGSVDETTSVPDVEKTTFEVTLEPGEYTYKCDPHPPMTGSFTVTG